jgi:leader peptidase (prepilin peptidase) / N-methyltransferase
MFFIFGACIGSYLNVLIYRLPQNIDTVQKGSFCRSCLKPLRWYENIPLLSYLALAGKCRSCKARISPQYPLVEFIIAILAVLLMPHRVTVESLLIFILMFSIGSIFLVHFVIDFRHKILPDKLNIALAVILLVLSLLKNSFHHIALGVSIGFGFTYLVTWVFYKLRGLVGLGGGDIKLFAALGLYLGPLGILQNIFLSCMIAALTSLGLMFGGLMKRDEAIPFGPFIILVASLQIYFPRYFDHFLRLIGFSFE